MKKTGLSCGLLLAVMTLAIPVGASAANPKTGPITNYSVTCAGPSFDYHNLPPSTRVWVRWTLGHQPFVLTLEQLVMLSGSGTFAEPVPVAVEQPTTMLDALVRVPSQGVQLDRSVPGGCTPAPPPPPVVVTPVPPPVVPTMAPPPHSATHHKMCHHRRRCHCGHKHHGHRGRHHRGKLRICHKPGIHGGFICRTHPHPNQGRG